jgi:thymidylate synthase (FAD)
VLEHAVWNFIIAGVSRAFTHELVRHRAGFGYSQLSQRYVDESTADFVEPDAIAGDERLHALWVRAVEASHRAYVELVEGLTEKYETCPTAPTGASWPARRRVACCPTPPRR